MAASKLQQCLALVSDLEHTELETVKVTIESLILVSEAKAAVLAGKSQDFKHQPKHRRRRPTRREAKEKKRLFQERQLEHQFEPRVIRLIGVGFRTKLGTIEEVMGKFGQIKDINYSNGEFYVAYMPSTNFSQIKRILSRGVYIDSSLVTARVVKERNVAPSRLDMTLDELIEQEKQNGTWEGDSSDEELPGDSTPYKPRSKAALDRELDGLVCRPH